MYFAVHVVKSHCKYRRFVYTSATMSARCSPLPSALCDKKSNSLQAMSDRITCFALASGKEFGTKLSILFASGQRIFPIRKSAGEVGQERRVV
ncbi:hypothetical protein ElyMa_005855700 [Elysia marginata]|uniref:Sema domain-containing protein n=1 Tax=Elysia marginata TaxID=1093978 RepID=A0AAV4FZZ8_9GAST|nr:hypothetical protein ElyMa_005855700 [Elysia marginata]